MTSDEEDFVFYGTPIEREEELTTRKKKAVAEASGQLRTALPPWKQEVRDEEGRRRFHGAFTGGFSAGYYNSVGSKEGWTPQSFTSSRKNRAEVKQQSILNFLDEDEKEEREGRSLGTNMQFDTFGFTAAELARKQIDKEQQNRPSAIPGPVPDELIMPASESIGVKLLLKMGWRQGRSIKSSSRDSLYDVRREGRKALLALAEKGEAQPSDSNLEEEDLKDVPDTPTSDDTQFSKSMPEYVLNPKQDLYGLGYDPFKHAPEFRERKRLKIGGDREKERHGSLSIKGKMAPGFGIGALEDLDAEDVDVYDHGYDFQDNYVQEIEEPSQGNKDTLRILDRRKDDVLPGFKAASRSSHQPERFDPPEIPSDFTPHHKFAAPFGSDGKNDKIAPPEVSPPEDNNLKVLIEGLATLVARCGKLFEDLSREKNQSNPLFAFLSGGDGSDYYARKLWEERQKRGEQNKLLDGIKARNSEPLNAEGRGKILGEKALERSLKDASSSAASIDVQFKLSDTFTKPASLSELPDVIKPFQDDPPKQKRFEQFLKEKYEGGLRPKDSSGSSDLSEAARARERLEFEAAAEAIAKGKSVNERNPPSQSLVDFSAAAGLQFTTGTIEKDKARQDDVLMAKAMYPKREVFEWRPAPILCKRFDLIDPYMGKPPPAPRPRSKMDSLIFMPDLIKPSTSIEHVSGEQKSSSIGKQDKDPIHEVESQVEVENVERPVDLYKSIFSDDSEDEDDDTTTSNQVEDAEKKTEAANTALNRLIAGDFLESLGKELGLAVPPDTPVSVDKSVSEVTRKEAINSDKENKKSRPTEENKSATRNGAEDHATLQTTANITDRVNTENRGSFGDDPKILDTRGTRNHGSSSEEDWGRKRSKSRRSKISSSDSDSSDDEERDDYRGRHHKSRTKRNEKRSSSRDRNSSRRHSKHHKHKHKRKESSSTSRRDHEDRKRRKHKYED